MGVYVYTVRKPTVTLDTGETVAKMSYAYKDFYLTHSTPKSWIRQADRMENRAFANAHYHQQNNTTLVAIGDKFVHGATVLRFKNRIPFKVYDTDYGNGELVGYLVKVNSKTWSIYPA